MQDLSKSSNDYINGYIAALNDLKTKVVDKLDKAGIKKTTEENFNESMQAYLSAMKEFFLETDEVLPALVAKRQRMIDKLSDRHVAGKERLN